VSRAEARAGAPAPVLGRCGNGDPERPCRNAVASGYNPLRLCAACLSRYPAPPELAGLVLHVGHYVARRAVSPAARPRLAKTAVHVIALPPHAPCGGDGCGSLDAAGVATCTERRLFTASGQGQAQAHPGCGATFALCARCGLRLRVNGGPCTACNRAMSGVTPA
jgi:hypothetical protein